MNDSPNIGLKILLVEDDNDDIQFFTEAIKKLEFKGEVTVVRTCDQLFAQLTSNGYFDVVFLDINIPLSDGHQCLKKIKASDLFKDIPIIMFTGSSAESDIRDGYENGAHYHVVKPYAHSNYVESLKIVFKENWKEKPQRPAKENFVVNLTFN